MLKLAKRIKNQHRWITSIGDKSRETCLRWFGHVQRRPTTTPVRRNFFMQVNGQSRKMRRLKKTRMVARIDLIKCNLPSDWPKKIMMKIRFHVADPSIVRTRLW